jgi:hypothetical protein
MDVKKPEALVVNISASPSGPICPGTPVSFTAATADLGIDPEYRWTKNGIHVGENLAVYTDSGLADQDVICCTFVTNLKDAGSLMIRSGEIRMKVYNTRAGFSITENFAQENGNITLNNTSTGADFYSWDLGNGQTSSAVNPSVTYMNDGSYQITLIVKNSTNNCTDTFSLTYKMLFKGLFIPNAFAPEAINTLGGVFKPAGMRLQDYKIEIYDNKGQLMWESARLDENGTPVEAWDGTYQGKPMPQGTYLWKAHAVFMDDTAWRGPDNKSEKGSKIGTVMLLR